MAGSINDYRVIHIAVEGRIRTTCRINNDEIQIFVLQFLESILGEILRFGGKTNQDLAVFGAAKFFQDIDRRFEFHLEIRVLLFDFLRSHRLRPKVQGRCGLDDDIRIGRIVHDGASHFVGRADMNGVRKMKCCRTGNQCDLRSPFLSGLRQRISHFS